MLTKPNNARFQSYTTKSFIYIVNKMWQMNLMRRFKCTNKWNDHHDAIIINFHCERVINFDDERTVDDNVCDDIVVVGEFFSAVRMLCCAAEINVGVDVSWTRIVEKNMLGIAAIHSGFSNDDNIDAVSNTIFPFFSVSYEKCARILSKSGTLLFEL